MNCPRERAAAESIHEDDRRASRGVCNAGISAADRRSRRVARVPMSSEWLAGCRCAHSASTMRKLALCGMNQSRPAGDLRRRQHFENRFGVRRTNPYGSNPTGAVIQSSSFRRCRAGCSCGRNLPPSPSLPYAALDVERSSRGTRARPRRIARLRRAVRVVSASPRRRRPALRAPG